MKGTLGMVFMGNGHAEEGKDTIPQ